MFSIEKFCGLEKIESYFSILVPVDLGDVEFTYNVRAERKNSFLKPMEGSVENQRQYIKTYLNKFSRCEEVFYKIYDKTKERYVGVVRITELKSGTVVNWESLVVEQSCSPQVPIDVMLVVYGVVFDWLERDQCGPWIVDREFGSMMKIHKKIGMAKTVDSDDSHYHVLVEKRDFDARIEKYRRLNLGILPKLAV